MFRIRNIKNEISFAFYLTSENVGRFLQTTHYYSLSSALWEINVTENTANFKNLENQLKFNYTQAQLLYP